MIARYYFAAFTISEEGRKGSVVVSYRSIFPDPLAVHKLVKSIIDEKGKNSRIDDFRRIK